jgi:hypothetical protein
VADRTTARTRHRLQGGRQDTITLGRFRYRLVLQIACEKETQGPNVLAREWDLPCQDGLPHLWPQHLREDFDAISIDPIASDRRGADVVLISQTLGGCL